MESEYSGKSGAAYSLLYREQIGSQMCRTMGKHAPRSLALTPRWSQPVTSSSKQLPVQRKTAEAGPWINSFSVGGVLSRGARHVRGRLPDPRFRNAPGTRFFTENLYTVDKKTSLPTKIEIRYGTVGKRCS